MSLETLELMQPIYRSVYRAQARPGQAESAADRLIQLASSCRLGLAVGEVMTISLFRWRTHFFTYWESIDQPVTPDAIFAGMDDLLLAWPGAATARTFVPMMDIFHYLAAESVDQWRRKTPVDQSWARLARLRPELVSSYIFYHYQLQEEKPGSGDKYGLISLHENLIFFYQERPALIEAEPSPGKLTTHNTPDRWHDVMFPHFDLWDDAEPGQEIWRDVALLIHR
jgi:hypothetical protein